MTAPKRAPFEFLTINSQDAPLINKNFDTLYKNLYNVPLYSADPSSPANGDVWILESGSTHRLKWRAGNTTYYVNGT